jgi:hypothetical protein
MAQSNEVSTNYGQSASGGQLSPTVTITPAQGFPTGDDVLGVPAFVGGDVNARGGETFCPAGYLAGQGPSACTTSQWYFYDDLNFCVTPPTTCKRVRCENFPDPTHTINKAIGVISWTGVYVDDLTNGCTKAQHLFRVTFYSGAVPDPANPVHSEEHVALAVDTGRTVLLSPGTVPATVWLFTFVLDTPVNMTTGWFAVTGDGTPGCYHLWEGSSEGDNSIYQWSEQPMGSGLTHVTDKCDLTYCFGEKIVGACCDDCAAVCTENASDVYCAGIGGRFVQNGTCAAMTPQCGLGLGACCYDDGTCLMKKCEGQGADFCLQPPPPQYCVGDLNCDGTINFGDINPFVLYLSNNATWQSTYPGCDPRVGDINCDGIYGQGSFADINPFVALMTQCGTGCPCPGPIVCPGPSGPRAQGPYWAGPGTVCPTSCCTVVVPPGALLENEPNDCAADTFNGGCNITPALFSPINCGDTIYGESGTFGGTRDMDWYRTTVTGPRAFTVTVEAEFDVAVWAFRQGPDPGNPCVGYADVAAPVAPLQGTSNKCTPVQLATRCLPAGTYWFVVAPASFSGVTCGSDYKVTLECGNCDPCSIPACPGGAYVEGTAAGVPGYCQIDPNDPTNDPYNGGCNVTPNAFETLPYNPANSPDIFTFCGKVWANNGGRDLDWWGLNLVVPTQVSYSVTSEVPVQAILVDGDANGGPSTCDALWGFWGNTLFAPCVTAAFNDTTYRQPGLHYFMVMPADSAGNPIWYGYPCPMGSADLGNDYTITMTVLGVQCQSAILLKPHASTESSNPPCPPPNPWNDSFNGGCDYPAGLPNDVALLPFDAANGWVAQSATWQTDPNDPNTLKKDYDWYKFTLTAQRRFSVYLYADFPATWEIYRASGTTIDCAYGPIEGLDVPACSDLGVQTVRCYPAATYYLRVYPTTRVTCGKYYYLALTAPVSCTVCALNVTGAVDLDDPCDDLTDYDTNAGCDDPNAPPPHFMAFACGGTYQGRIYAGLQNGAAYYDPDWFTVTQTNTVAKRIKLTATTEFLAHIEVYASCADYPGTVLAGLEGITAISTGCPNIILTSTGSFAQGTVVYGRITCVDQFGNLLTKYYPCAKNMNRWKVVVACIT